uniref:hypothetical protein RF1 n=1 Tax=Thonningia sanguinea TaxID=1618145 RepID=UPI0026E3CDA9|nr:hypothetical protein RF1 [Thonningia sanguinea]WJE89133.1 hypothetical protein RF1 [Thonningia sanguinea]
MNININLNKYFKIVLGGFLTGFFYGFFNFSFLVPIYYNYNNSVFKLSNFFISPIIIFIFSWYFPINILFLKPHIINILSIPILLLYLDNNKIFKRNYILKSFIFQLFNYLLFPKSILTRLLNIYIFRYNILVFFIHFYIGYLINYNLLYNLKKKIKYIIKRIYLLIYFNKKLTNIILFSIFFLLLGKIPLKINFNKPKFFNIINITSNRIKDYNIKSIYNVNLEKKISLVFFNFKKWIQPIRYVKNDKFEDLFKIEVSQFFFYMYNNLIYNEKNKLGYMYPPSLFFFTHFLINFIEQIKLEVSNYNYINFKTTRLCYLNDKKKVWIRNLYDPLISKSYRKLKTITFNQCNNKFLNKFIKIFNCELKGKGFIFKKSFLKEINKQFPRWSYKLLTELEQQENDDNFMAEDWDIRSRKSKDFLIFSNSTNRINTDDFFLIDYFQYSDWDRDLIKGSLRTYRRKVIILRLLQLNVHSPLFLIRTNKIFFNEIYNIFFKRRKRSLIKKTKRQMRLEISEFYTSIPIAQFFRSLLLIIQSFFRKYIKIPFCIIIKNIIIYVIFKSYDEWLGDYIQWKNEEHKICSYNGIQLSEDGFPKNWLNDGIQIKIINPFSFKLKYKSKQNGHSFLNVFGMETKVPFGSTKVKKWSFYVFIKKKIKMLKFIKKKKTIHKIKNTQTTIYYFNKNIFLLKWYIYIIYKLQYFLYKIINLNVNVFKKKQIINYNDKHNIFKTQMYILYKFFSYSKLKIVLNDLNNNFKFIIKNYKNYNNYTSTRGFDNNIYDILICNFFYSNYRNDLYLSDTFNINNIKNRKIIFSIKNYCKNTLEITSTKLLFFNFVENQSVYKLTEVKHIYNYIINLFTYQLGYNGYRNFCKKIINNIKIYNTLIINKQKYKTNIIISYINRIEINLEILLTKKDLNFSELVKKGVLFIEPICIFEKHNNIKLYINNIIKISYINKKQIKQKKNPFNFYNYIFLKLKQRHFKKYISFFLINCKHKKLLKINNINIKTIVFNSFNNNKLNWSPYKFEDLLCINRFYFNTINGLNFNLLRTKFN